MNIDCRYTMEHEHPCQFCTFMCECEFWEMNDEDKKQKCRPYFYFLLLKKYEDKNSPGINQMASGCIISMAYPECDDIVWEDEWDMVKDTIIHSKCRMVHITRKYGLSEEQFNRQAIELFLKYKIISPDALARLIDKGKIEKFDSYQNLLNQYREQ